MIESHGAVRDFSTPILKAIRTTHRGQLPRHCSTRGDRTLCGRMRQLAIADGVPSLAVRRNDGPRTAAIVPISLTNEFAVKPRWLQLGKNIFCATAVPHIGAQRLQAASTEKIMLAREPRRPITPRRMKS